MMSRAGVLRARRADTPGDTDTTSLANERSDAHSVSLTGGASGNEPFESFFRRHEREIFGYLWRITNDEQAAYDLSQECFVRAWRNYDKVCGYEQPRAWLFRIATNLALNHRRHRAVAANSLANLPPGGSTGNPETDVVERDAVCSALLALPLRQRTALVLRVVYGLDFEQIADALGVSTAAAKMTLSRSREQFRTCYLHGDMRRA